MAEDASRKNLKLNEEAHAKATDAKNDGETWSEFMHRAVDELESKPSRKASPDQTREAVRKVLREDATRDLLSTEIESVVEERIHDDIETVIGRNPPTEIIREIVTDVLHSEGAISEPLPVDRDSHDDLVEVIETAPSQEWVNNFLDLVAELIEITGVTPDDDQLVMSIRTDQKSLPISLGNRYCLKGYVEDGELGVILPHGSTAVNELQRKGVSTGQFNGEEDPPHWHSFLAPSADDVTVGEYHEDWQQAVEAERERGHKRVRGDAHEPAVYHVATDADYRQRVLSDAEIRLLNSQE
jgi:hypothetical protein